MTTIITLLIGAGVLLVVSSINGCSLKVTFQNIIDKKPINTPCA